MSGAMSDQSPSLALFTDLYELTMAQAYWQSGQIGEATFSLFVRSYPPARGYFVLAGIEDCLDYLEEFRFSEHDTGFLRSLDRFDADFVEYLGGLRFTGSVRAIEEGGLFFANEPVMQVTAPIIEAQLAETYLLNQVSLQSVLATKASRVVHAAAGRALVDFAARRTHGTDAANKLARVSYMAGFAGTSNVLAGKLYGIPTFGTMAHSFVQSFASEEESFRAYAASFPDSTTLLVDTYDTIEGVRRAITVAQEMGRRGHSMQAIRLDSGDLLGLARRARALLDEAGLESVQVLASGGLDEIEVDRLVRAGAPIDGFGVGTKMGVSADAPWADSACKLVQYDGRPVLKLSPGKQTAPGPKQVFRYRDAGGRYVRDVIGVAGQRPPMTGGEPLLAEVMRDGRRTDRSPAINELRRRFREEFGRLPDECKALKSPAAYPVVASVELQRLQQATIDAVRSTTPPKTS